MEAESRKRKERPGNDFHLSFNLFPPILLVPYFPIPAVFFFFFFWEGGVDVYKGGGVEDLEGGMGWDDIKRSGEGEGKNGGT